MKGFFDSFVVERPEFSRLPEGDHNLRLVRVEYLDSFKNYDGSDKDKEFEWADPVPQIAVTVVAADTGKTGGMTHRFNGLGYVRWDDPEVTDAMRKKGMNLGGYLCVKDADGDLVRMKSEARTAQAASIINEFAAALKIPAKANIVDGLQEAIENKVVFRAKVTHEVYNGKDQYRLGTFRPVGNAFTQATSDESTGGFSE